MFKKLLALLGFGKKSKSALPDSGPSISAEEMCGINASIMTKEAIRKKLAQLYKRHNNAASSLNPERRKEASMMLEAIVECRQRYVDSA